MDNAYCIGLTGPLPIAHSLLPAEERGTMYDTHVHSTFSVDGTSTFDEYSKLLDKKELNGIGFTEHLDFLPECGSYNYFDYDIYISSINKFREMGCEFYAGAEVDFVTGIEDEIVETLNRQSYDYSICSVHMINKKPVSDKHAIELFKDTNTFRNVLEKYYSEIINSLNVGKIDVIGHIGIYKRYLEQSFINNHTLKDLIKELDFEAAKACALSDKIIEVNSSGLFTQAASVIPNTEFLKTYFEFGGRRVSIGSDAHNTSHVIRGFKEVKVILKGIGFNYTILPWDKEKEYRI